MAQVTGIELVIEGRTFVQEAPTFEQEMYIMQQVMDAGLDQPHLKLGIDPKTKDLERPVKQIIVEAYRSGVIFKLIGSMVTEKGTEWSPEQAERNAALFKNTRDPESKKQLHPALVGAIVAFFQSAASSDEISLISSGEKDESSRPSASTRPRMTPTQAEAVFRSGTMESRSEKSPSTKGSRFRKRSAGKSAKG